MDCSNTYLTNSEQVLENRFVELHEHNVFLDPVGETSLLGLTRGQCLNNQEGFLSFGFFVQVGCIYREC